MQPSGDRPVIVSFRLEHVLGWGITLVLCVVPIFLWLHMHPLATIHSFPIIMLSLARITGLVGMVMYALNLVYATRLRILEPLFGGLNRVYIAHHLLGGFALMFLSFHPLFLALRYIKVSLLQATLTLLPNGLSPVSALFNSNSPNHAGVLLQWAVFMGILAFWGMVGLLLITFFIKIPYRIWLITHKFLGVTFFLAGIHVLFVRSDTSINGPLKYYILAMTAIGLIAYVYRTLVGRILIRRYRYSIQKIHVDPGKVIHIIMQPVKQTMTYKPGQFVFVRFLHAADSEVSKEWHPFSISSAPGSNMLRLSVKGLGDYTNKLSAIKINTLAEIEGAYGKFSYTNFKNKKQIWVAGGIGITPFLSMARDLPSTDYMVDLYYSVKTTSELIDWAELQEIVGLKKGNFRIFPYVADQQKGYLDADYIEKTSGVIKGKDIFICGPPAMMKGLRKQFKQKSVPGTAIHSEEFAMS